MLFFYPWLRRVTREARASKETERDGRARGIVGQVVWSVLCDLRVWLQMAYVLQALAHDDGHRSLARGFAANEERNVVLAEIYDRALEHERARGEIEGFLTSNLERDEGAAVSLREGRNQTNAGRRRCSTVVVSCVVASE